MAVWQVIEELGRKGFAKDAVLEALKATGEKARRAFLLPTCAPALTLRTCFVQLMRMLRPLVSTTYEDVEATVCCAAHLAATCRDAAGTATGRAASCRAQGAKYARLLAPYAH